tara:strand:+ start:162 stop:521 length:360 start_codon:yes stop_codon:yes gene_type:complete
MSPTMTNTFIIHPNGLECYVKITCNINLNRDKYVIDYVYDYSSTINTPIKQINILKYLELYDSELKEPYSGDIIHRNSLSEQLVKYLCMSDKELEKHSGNVQAENYRVSVIKSIQLLWD